MKRSYSLLSAALVALGVMVALGWYLLLPSAAPLVAAPTQQEGPAPRIVGGEEAPAGAYPWMTALVANNVAPAAGQFCGGALIHREWVMTAAHCVTSGTQVDPPASIDIVVGLHRLSENNGIRRDLQAIIVHPQWEPASYDYDIALLHLAQPIDGVTPVAIVQPSDAPIFAPGQIARVMGWGATAWQGTGSDVLLQVDIPIVSQQTCRDSYGADDITDRMLCAGLAGGGKDSCQGDSGGPLVVNDNSVWKEVGIVSWGQGCAFPDFYGIYARVAVLYAWVTQHVDLTPATPTVTPTVTGTPPTATATFPPRAYLPQVARPNTPTPTRTATPTSTPTPPANSLVNPGFEQGRGVGWQEFSQQGWDLIVNSGFPGNVTPHSGQWAAWLGGDDNEIAYVRQSVTIPAGASILSFWTWIASADSCGFDFGGVVVNGQPVNSFNLCSSTNTNGWVRRTVNLGAYAGQNVALQIRAETDGSLNSNLFVDDVALTNAAGALIRPAPLRPGWEQATMNKAAADMPRRAALSAPEGRLWAPVSTEKQ